MPICPWGPVIRHTLSKVPMTILHPSKLTKKVVMKLPDHHDVVVVVAEEEGKKCNDAPWWLFVVNTSSVCMIIIACTLRTYHCNVGFGGPLSTRPLYTP